MKEKKNSATEWIIFSVLSVILPVIIAFIVSSIINHKALDISDVIDSIILVVFSIACSLFSICWSVHKQESCKLTKLCFVFSGTIIFLSWTLYVISLTSKIQYFKEICIISLVIVIFCSILGIRLGIQNDENENNIISLMHRNCEKIRKELIIEEYNNAFKPHLIREYDLLCNPDEFDRIKEVMKTFKNHEVVNK